MITRWDGNRLLADRETIAAFYEVSTRTVRRHCRPAGPTGEGGRVLYDALAAGTCLAGIAARPARTRAMTELRRRMVAAT